MKLDELLKKSFARGDSCLLIGEDHFEKLGYKGLGDCLETIKILNKQKQIIIIAEIPALSAGESYKLDTLSDTLPSDKRTVLSKLIKSNIPVLGCENEQTQPFDSLKTVEQIDEKLKALGLFGFLTTDAEYLRSDIEEYRHLAMAIYAESPLRIAIPNKAFCDVVQSFPDSFCLFIGGSKHIPSLYNEEGICIDQGMLKRLKSAEATFVTDDKRIGSPYIPSKDGEYSFSPIEIVTTVSPYKTGFFKPVKPNVEHKENNKGFGCTIL